MFARLAVIVCAFCLLRPAIAAEPTPSGGNACRQALPTIRELWRHGLYDAPPAADAVMVDAIDGNLPRVRQGLTALPAGERAHWRQVAMLTAAWSDQSAVVDGLLDDGAAADGTVRLPPFKPAFHRQMLDTMGRDPRFGGPGTVRTLQSAGIVDHGGRRLGPALLAAVECDDVATLDVLLRHHANVMVRATPNTADALTTAVVDGHAPLVQRLLDHGADVCADDRHIRKPGATLAGIGERRGLPAALVAELVCRVPGHAGG